MEALMFGESMCGRKDEQWRWSGQQDTDNMQKEKNGEGEKREEQKKLAYFKINFCFGEH